MAAAVTGVVRFNRAEIDFRKITVLDQKSIVCS